MLSLALSMPQAIPILQVYAIRGCQGVLSAQRTRRVVHMGETARMLQAKSSAPMLPCSDVSPFLCATRALLLMTMDPGLCLARVQSSSRAVDQVNVRTNSHQFAPHHS